MAVTVAEERRTEWPYFRASLIAVGVVLVVWLLGWGVYELVHHDPTRLELTTRCLVHEKRATVTSPAGDDPIAAGAKGGSLATRIEGNGVHLSIAGSTSEAERIVSDYQSVAGPLVGKLERRGRYVYLWEGVASPTQRQTMFDCEY